MGSPEAYIPDVEFQQLCSAAERLQYSPRAVGGRVHVPATRPHAGGHGHPNRPLSSKIRAKAAHRGRLLGAGYEKCFTFTSPSCALLAAASSFALSINQRTLAINCPRLLGFSPTPAGEGPRDSRTRGTTGPPQISREGGKVSNVMDGHSRGTFVRAVVGRVNKTRPLRCLLL